MHGLRSGLRSISTLALVIGAATAMFGVVNGVFLEAVRDGHGDSP